ncbi:hypothetical protein [Salipaludibacillus neizhouensis]|nr:hypothetical protein [Salipaludibacillus neizhouensis]
MHSITKQVDKIVKEQTLRREELANETDSLKESAGILKNDSNEIHIK